MAPEREFRTTSMGYEAFRIFLYSKYTHALQWEEGLTNINFGVWWGMKLVFLSMCNLWMSSYTIFSFRCPMIHYVWISALDLFLCVLKTNQWRYDRLSIQYHSRSMNNCMTLLDITCYVNDFEPTNCHHNNFSVSRQSNTLRWQVKSQAHQTFPK